MGRSWRWIVGFGGFGAVLTFLFSIGSNTPTTTLIRSFYAFVAFAVLALLVRIVLTVLLKPSASRSALPQAVPEDDRGAVLDVSTPSDDADLTDLMKSQWSGELPRPAGDFQPLQPSRLVSVDNVNTEEMVQAVRHMKDE